MLRFAWTAISSFSAMPLRLSIFWGLFVTACGIGYGVYSIFAAYVLHKTVPGWTSLVCLNVIFSGTTMMAIGLVGEYVARIYEEAKGRPLYVVSRTANCEAAGAQVPGAVILPTETPSSSEFGTAAYSAVRRII
jgi:dolichol-phosphate mannosyltransferase